MTRSNAPADSKVGTSCSFLVGQVPTPLLLSTLRRPPQRAVRRSRLRGGTAGSIRRSRPRTTIAPAQGNRRLPLAISAPRTRARTAPAWGNDCLSPAISSPRTQARTSSARGGTASSHRRSRRRGPGRGQRPLGGTAGSRRRSAPGTLVTIAPAGRNGQLPSAISAPRTRARRLCLLQRRAVA